MRVGTSGSTDLGLVNMLLLLLWLLLLPAPVLAAQVLGMKV